jgi:hypothetical protein
LGFQSQAGHGRDGRQRFAPEPQGVDREQVIGIAKLARGMSLKGQQGVIADHSGAVIDDLYAAPAARFYMDADAVGAGIERIFEQLLDDGSGPLDDFAGGNPIGDRIRKYADASHDEWP